MNKTIIELIDESLTQRGTEAIIDFYRTIAIDQLQLPGLHAFATGVDSSSLNVVIDTRKNAVFDFEMIKCMADFFGGYQVPWGCFISDFSTAEAIEKQGFNLSYKSPAMYFDLSEIFPKIENNTIEIKEADSDLQDWIQPLQEGFPSDDNCETYRKLNAELLRSGEKKLRHFTAYYKNEPVSSGTLFLSDNSVMLHNLATKNKFKNHGFATRLTLHMLSEAKKSGYRHCFLDSSDEGFNLYTKLGFKVYSVTSVYER